MEWTHSICRECWNERNPDRQAHVVASGPAEICCFCGKPNDSGIYVRHDPRLLTCVHSPNPTERTAVKK